MVFYHSSVFPNIFQIVTLLSYDTCFGQECMFISRFYFQSSVKVFYRLIPLSHISSNYSIHIYSTVQV